MPEKVYYLDIYWKFWGKGKANQNRKVIRFHREDQERFYDNNIFKNIKQLGNDIMVWNNYNNLEHCGLNGKTPNEMLKLN